MTGDKHLDKQVEAYFKFPPDSSQRTEYLKNHPEVQDYFDLKNPADAAIHRILEVYFEKAPGAERKRYLLFHQEIQDYFDRKKQEKQNMKDLTEPFALSDPRLSEYFLRAQSEVTDPAKMLFESLRARVAANLASEEIEDSRTRRRKNKKRDTTLDT
jgi:hypothetical protein